MNPRAIRLTIDSRIENIPLVGLAVNQICSAATLTSVERGQIELCLVEAVTNSIEHAYGMRTDRQVEVELVLHANRIVMRVVDHGHPLPCLHPPRQELDPDDRANLPEGGMGLFIINSMMSESAYHSEGGRNTLELIKHLPTTTIDRRHGGS